MRSDIPDDAAEVFFGIPAQVLGQFAQGRGKQRVPLDAHMGAQPLRTITQHGCEQRRTGVDEQAGVGGRARRRGLQQTRWTDAGEETGGT